MMLPSLAFYFVPSLSIFVMIAAYLLQLGVLFGSAGRVTSEPPFNNPPGVDIWCGKAYRPENASFNPGGWLDPPKKLDDGIPNEQRITLRVYPRYSYYLPTDKTASLIVETPVNYYGSFRYENWTYDPDTSPSTKIPFTEMKLSVSNPSKNVTLINWKRVPVNQTGIEVEISLEGVTGKETFQVTGNSPDGIQSFYGQTHIDFLPERNDTGSMSRIDRLYGGMQVRSSLTNHEWKTIFPYSFYTSWDWIVSTINNATAEKNLTTYRNLGYNIIHPVPPGGDDPYDPSTAFGAAFTEFLKICDSLELYVMYDMRHTYQNNTSISIQLERLQKHPSLLLYYTGDEPDGWCDPLNATSIAYNHIRSIDPYHPVSLVLNCFNFYFGEYTSGADIIMEDTYPVIKSATFSPVYDTVCNLTYGDCGCDDCHANDPAYPEYVASPFKDVIDRTDNMYTFQNWLQNSLSRTWTKPVWGVPQAFFDRDSFWSRWPTAKEEAVMHLLRLNHGAKAIVAWIYPTSDELEALFSQLSKLVTRPDITGLLLGAPRTQLNVAAEPDTALFDAAAWTSKDEMLIIVVYAGTKSRVGQKATVGQLPKNVTDVEVLYGYNGWTTGLTDYLTDEKGMEAFDVSILKAKILDA